MLKRSIVFSIALSLQLLVHLSETSARYQDLNDPAWQRLLCSQEQLMGANVTRTGVIMLADFPVTTKAKIPVDPKEFFLHPIILEELQLDVRVRDGISKAIDDLQMNIQSLGRRQGQLNDTPATTNQKDEKAVATELTKLRDECFSRIESLLTNSEKKRLRELQLRFLIYRNGLTNFLSQSAVQELIGINTVEVAALRKAESKVRKELLEKERELSGSILEAILKPLDEQQRQLVKRDWAEKIAVKGGLTALTWQLIYQEHQSFSSEELKSTAVVWERPYYVHGADGNLELRFSEHKKESAEQRQLGYDDYNMLQGMLLRAENIEILGLTQEQVELIDSIKVETELLKEEIGKEIWEAMGYKVTKGTNYVTSATGVRIPRYDYEGVTDEDGAKGRAMVFQRLMAPCNEAHKRMLDVLVSHQRNTFDGLLVEMKVKDFGVLADLEFGHLGTEVKLTEKQKVELKAIAKELVERINVETRKAREDAILSLVSVLPQEDQRVLKRAIGKDPASGRADLSAVANMLKVPIKY